VLVDEFQDTDPLQAEVLFYLTGEDLEEKNWRKLRPRAGSLFIVGDPKQSIYRFRRADITTYLEVRKLVETSGGEIHQLSTNFRSMPPICTFVNDSFRSLFVQTDVDAGRQAPHVDLVAFHDAAAPCGVYSLESQADKNDIVAEAEAERIGKWILRSVGKDLHFSDILLVSWQRPRLSFYARVFERLGIPYEITGSKAFERIDALEKAMPLLSAIVDPDDEVSTVAFLRGPLNGADDDALYRFVRAGGRFSPFKEVPEGTDERIGEGLRVISEAIKDARQHPPAAAIARLFDRLGLLPLSASGERPGTRSGNLLLALAIARDASARGESLASIVEQLAELLESEPDIEELDVDPARTDAVRLMNLHQVKGLEAPIVFLIDPADEYDFPIDLYVDRSGEESRGHFVVRREWGKGTKDIAVPPGWDGYKQIEEQFKAAEKMRLLYVAATRAKRMLVVGFRRTAKGVRGAWRELAGRVRDGLQLPGEVAATQTALPPAARQFAEARAEIASRLEVAKETSYSVLPITKIAHANHAELVRAEEGLGKGMSWGRVLHRLFEAMLRDESLDVRLYAENLLKDEERDVVELAEVMRVVEAVQSSPLWKRVKASDERYVEIPFALNVPAASLALPPNPPHTLLHGTIDLVFREKNEWFVVDYKTDSTLNRLDALTEYYAPQVRLYADFWSRLTGGRTRGGLFFVDGCVEGWVG
jgi:ATP-dependent helicase/nuclease subunit A